MREGRGEEMPARPTNYESVLSEESGGKRQWKLLAGKRLIREDV